MARAVDQEGEILESSVTKTRDKAAALGWSFCCPRGKRNVCLEITKLQLRTLRSHSLHHSAFKAHVMLRNIEDYTNMAPFRVFMLTIAATLIPTHTVAAPQYRTFDALSASPVSGPLGSACLPPNIILRSKSGYRGIQSERSGQSIG